MQPDGASEALLGTPSRSLSRGDARELFKGVGDDPQVVATKAKPAKPATSRSAGYEPLPTRERKTTFRIEPGAPVERESSPSSSSSRPRRRSLDMNDVVKMETDRHAYHQEVHGRSTNLGGGIYEKLSGMVVIPEHGSRVGRLVTAWDITTSLLVLLCAYATPFTLALPTVARTQIFWLNVLLDIVFTADLVSHFFIAYHDDDSESDTLWVRDPVRIARSYCGGWFWIDLLSVLPSCFQVFVGSDDPHLLVALRSLRLFRLLRFSTFAKRIEEMQATTGLPFFFSDIIKFVFITTFVSHTAACIWVMLEGKVEPTWVRSSESWLSALRSGKGDCCSPDAEHDPLCVYNFALYWAMMTLTSVGYGDITPQHPLEYFACTTFMLFAGLLWAYIVGSVVSLLSQLEPDNALFKQRVDALNALMEQRHLPHHLVHKLREYMVQSRNVSIAKHQRTLLEENLSKGLQRAVVLETTVFHLFRTKVYWARELEEDVMLEIIRLLETHVYSPQECIPVRDRMLIIREGIVALAGRIMSRNQVIGENQILLVSEDLADDPLPRTLSYVTVLVLTKETLISVCEQYPKADERLRKAQMRTAVWRGFIRAAHQRSRVRKAHRAGPSASGSSREITWAPSKEVSGFARSHNNKDMVSDNLVSGAELRDLEDRLRKGQRDMGYQLQDMRELLALQKEKMAAIAQRLQQPHSSSPTDSGFVRRSFNLFMSSSPTRSRDIARDNSRGSHDVARDSPRDDVRGGAATK